MAAQSAIKLLVVVANWPALEVLAHCMILQLQVW
jgi:hypothetical protein